MTFDHVVLLNWKAAEETLSCLQNILDMGVKAKIVVADNASGDGSVEAIYSWMKKNGSSVHMLRESDLEECALGVNDYDMVVIENLANHGFAGGNNPAIRFAANRAQDGIIWLLNSDARVDEKTFPALRRRLSEDSSVGFVGSVIRYYEAPDRLQCYGGMRIHPLFGKRSLYMKGVQYSRLHECDEADVDCLMGASLAFRASLARDLGVMEEAYFMYAEEVDWQIRAKAAGWKVAVARDSNIFHKGALSTRGRSYMYHYYINRSSVMLSKRFYGVASLFTVVPSLLAYLALKNWRHPKSLIFGVKGVFDGVRFKWGGRR